MAERRRQRRTVDRRALMVVVLSVIIAACAAPRAELRPVARGTVDIATAPTAPEVEPDGTVRVAYPEESAGFLDLRHDDPAAADLLALWGLPLFRVDPAGQLVAGLVEDWDIVDAGEGWHVELALRSGRWSDGREVTATDVLATLDALRAGPRSTELRPLIAVTRVDDHRVRLGFEVPYARWWSLLDGVGVLPAHVLAEAGTGAYDDDVPVSGGWFTVEEHEPGLRTTFAAHVDGPLGAPALDGIEVAVVPRYETALGLQARGDVDVVLGYLALNAVERARRIDRVDAAAPRGGTTVLLRWRPDGPVGDPEDAGRRRAVAAAIDVSQLVEGLLGPAGEVASAVVPGVLALSPGTTGEMAEVGSPTVVVPRWHEATAFTGRALQRDLRAVGGGMQLVAETTPDVIGLARTIGDAALLAHRTGPRPTLVGTVHDPDVAVAGDAGGPGSATFAAALARAAEDVLVQPLYRIGVAHAWSPEVQGLRPSAWPGLAFWDAGSWRRDPAVDD